MKSGLEKNSDSGCSEEPIRLFKVQHTILLLLTAAVTVFAVLRFFR